MVAVACDGRSHSSAMRKAAFSSSYDEVKVALCCCFVRRVVGLAGSPSVTTIPAPLLSVPAVDEPSVYIMPFNTSAVRKLVGGGSMSVPRMRALADA